MRPAPRWVTACDNMLKFAESTSPMWPCCDQLARVHQRRIAARLEADGRAQRAFGRQVGHLLGLGDVRAERPLAEDRFAGLEGLHDQVVVPGHADRHDHQVDVRLGDHRLEVVKRELGAERRRRRLRRLLVGRADGFELVVRQRVQCRDVGVGAPAAAARRDGGAHDADANLGCHADECSQSRVYPERACPNLCFCRPSTTRREAGRVRS